MGNDFSNGLRATEMLWLGMDLVSHSANLEGILSTIKISDNLMTTASNRQSLKFELLAIYPRHRKSYDSWF